MNIVDKALQDERCWTVYIHTNKINEKRYVGITSKEPEARWGIDGTRYKSQPFYKAIEKYGWDNFDHEIIASNLTCDEANQFEIALIRELDTLIRNGNGYNTTEGGKGTKGGNKDRSMYTGANATNVKPIICLNTMKVYGCAKLACEEYDVTPASLSACVTGRGNYSGKDKNGDKLMWRYYDYTKDDEYYIELRDTTINRIKNHKNKGRKQSDAVIQKLSTPVVCINTATIYSSIKEASNITGVDYTSIGKCCKGKALHAGKDESGTPLKWMYLEEYEKLNNKNNEERDVI